MKMTIRAFKISLWLLCISMSFSCMAQQKVSSIIYHYDQDTFPYSPTHSSKPKKHKEEIVQANTLFISLETGFSDTAKIYKNDSLVFNGLLETKPQLGTTVVSIPDHFTAKNATTYLKIDLQHKGITQIALTHNWKYARISKTSSQWVVNYSNRVKFYR